MLRESSNLLPQKEKIGDSILGYRGAGFDYLLVAEISGLIPHVA